MMAALLLAAGAAAPTRAATPEQRLAAKGYALPPANAPMGTYVTSARVGKLMFLSGHGECPVGVTGKVGATLTEAEGRASAERVALCMLATMKGALGELSRVKRFVKVLGTVNATPEFTRHPAVVNGFSDLMVVAFGDAGKAPRSAVGVASLPMNIPVEVEAVVELK